MAEQDSAQEKTEEPTPKRLQKAREEGQIPRSKELTTFAVLMSATVGLFVFGGQMAAAMQAILEQCFSLDREVIFDEPMMLKQLGVAMGQALLSLMPFFAVVAFAAIVGPMALGGFLFSGKSLAPKWNRLDPVAGLKRMFSVRALVELFKGIAKVLLVIGVAYALMQMMRSELLNLSEETPESAIAHALELALWAAILMSASTLLIAAIDIPFQIWENTKKLRMSRQDIKDELKDTEGKPEVKSKVRQMQMQMAQSRMMGQVPDADVVITNPTHFSVALKYQPDTMDAPILLAKGVDHMAMKIREVAREHKIEFVESPALARAIYHTTDIDEEVPEGLYVAVAQVLAYVFQLREFRRGKGDRPAYPRSPNLPPDMRDY